VDVEFANHCKAVLAFRGSQKGWSSWDSVNCFKRVQIVVCCAACIGTGSSCGSFEWILIGTKISARSCGLYVVASVLTKVSSRTVLQWMQLVDVALRFRVRSNAQFNRSIDDSCLLRYSCILNVHAAILFAMHMIVFLGVVILVCLCSL
jgi:hypothetical protein